jgi:hypothetical protein
MLRLDFLGLAAIRLLFLVLFEISSHVFGAKAINRWAHDLFDWLTRILDIWVLQLEAFVALRLLFICVST